MRERERERERRMSGRQETVWVDLFSLPGAMETYRAAAHQWRGGNKDKKVGR